MSILSKLRKNEPILVAEDDEDDRHLIQEAFDECNFTNRLFFVKDGEELMSYLHREGAYSNKVKYPDPGIILLDLNMPRKDGRQALAEIKNHKVLKQTPVIVLTTSNEEQDIVKTYELGVNSFIIKPVSFASMVNVMKTIGKYWFEVVELPV